MSNQETEPIATVVAQTEATSTESKPFFPRTRKTPEELAEQQELDKRSVYVGNVDFKSTPDEVEEFFNSAGSINRVTILFDRYTGYPKGYAYVEFESAESVEKAVNELNGKEFRGRILSVVAKRTNLPGFSNKPRGSFRGRGRGGFRGRGRGRGGFRGGRGGYSTRPEGEQRAEPQQEQVSEGTAVTEE
ncbi:hypothetical protein WICMUC_002526 [Wickerhamomyces mucosus]|uniref:RRM domain-containing protein n=1 Tax=Wickerhamomyces mucosus TaxID=1378264 RepID=A0A9P8PR02_9ASCO|nr:hypothetical protein WICMUC_002526 [Wickerhamomyces mucosus]